MEQCEKCLRIRRLEVASIVTDDEKRIVRLLCGECRENVLTAMT